MATSVSRRSSAPVHPTRQQLEELDALLKRMLDLPVNVLDGEADAEEEAEPPAPPARTETPPAASPPEALRGPHHPELIRPTEAAPPAAVNYQTAETEEADLKPRVVAAPEAAPPAQDVGPPQAGDWVPLTSSWRPSARTWKPLSDAWRQGQVGPDGAAASPPWVRDISPTLPPEPAAAPPRVEAPPPKAVPAPAPAEVPAPKPALSPTRAAGTPWPLWPLIGFNAAFDACLTPWGPLGRWLRGSTGRSFLGILGLLFLTAAVAWAAAEWIGWTQ